MEKRTVLQVVLVTALASLAGAGCARQPAPPVAVAPPPAVDPAPVEETKGVAKQVVEESPAVEEVIRSEAAPGLERIYFDYDQYNLTPPAMDALAGNAAFLKSHPGIQVRIEGFCDERGSDEYNLALGERRAQASRDFLVSLGVSPDKLSTVSYGEESPLDPGSNEAAWASNRRAEFKVVR